MNIEKTINSIINKFPWEEIVPHIQDQYPQAYRVHIKDIEGAKRVGRELLHELLTSQERLTQVARSGLIAHCCYHYDEGMEREEVGLMFQMGNTSAYFDPQGQEYTL